MSDEIESRLMWDLTRSAEEFTQKHHDRTTERLLLDAGRRRRHVRARRASGVGGLAALAAMVVTFALTTPARPVQTADPPLPASTSVPGPGPAGCGRRCLAPDGAPGLARHAGIPPRMARNPLPAGRSSGSIADGEGRWKRHHM